VHALGMIVGEVGADIFFVGKWVMMIRIMQGCLFC